jgi:hypothetical protein
MEAQKTKKTLKQKLLHEISEYAINVVYLGLFFSAVIFYRRQVLAEYNVTLDDYFLGLIKAIVIGKVVMIAGFFPFVKHFDDNPLIFPTLFKSLVFTLWVMIFDLLEEAIRGLIGGSGMADLPAIWLERINPVWFASAILIFLCFIPFFAFKELVRVEGAPRIRQLFLHEK